MHEGTSRAVWMSVHVPEMQVHARGEGCKDRKLETIQNGLVGILKEQQREDGRHRKQKSACIIGYAVVHQDNVQTAWVCPPALYGTYEREDHESQFEHGREKKWYEELVTGRTPVAPCDSRDRASRICCGDGSVEGNAQGCYDKNERSAQHGCEQDSIFVPEHICSEDKKTFG